LPADEPRLNLTLLRTHLRSMPQSSMANGLLVEGGSANVMASDDDRATLRYLDAHNVERPGGTLAGVEVCGPNQQYIGDLGGVLVEPARRRVKYFVVQRPALLRRKQYLVPADCLTTLDPETGTIYIDVEDNAIERFDDSSVLPFSDEDLVDTMFASTAA
jgi:hypothetical protein